MIGPRVCATSMGHSNVVAEPHHVHVAQIKGVTREQPLTRRLQPTGALEQ